MKLRAQKSGLAVPATIAAVLPQDTLVAITGDRTVNKAGADAVVIGRLSVPAKSSNGTGTVETKFKELIEIKGSGALSAGATVKMAAADGVTGENVVVAWANATDEPQELFGIVWKGGGSGAVIEVLTY